MGSLLTGSQVSSLLFSTTRRVRMEVLAAVAAWAVSSLCQTQTGSPAGYSRLVSNFCPFQNATTDLGCRLSAGAQVFYPGSDGYADSMDRWSALEAPNFTFTVVPAVENDVVETVKYANKHNLPFLVVNSGHGAITTVGKMDYGIGIWLHQLDSVSIAADGKTATFGGGIKSKAVTDTLWAAGKQTVTGGCECVSLLGPGLGGGHGFLQARHGLIADQFVSMTIVLADGSLRTIDERSDLWWAMKGAGHNFGIVTSVTSKIYDIKHPNWAYKSFIFTHDKVENLYAAINRYLLKKGTQPVDITNYGFFFNNPAMDPDHEGASAVNPIYTDPFTALGPVVATGGTGSYLDIPAWTGNGNDALPCQNASLVNIRFPIDLQTYDVQAMRHAFDLFASTTHKIPALNGSLFLFEGYSLQGVQQIPSKTTAFPFRGDTLLLAPFLIYKANGKELDKQANKFGEGMRNILYKASGSKELHTYVNYAFGDENIKSWYGYEQWRQDKLLALKKKYDPKRKFSFYAPIQ